MIGRKFAKLDPRDVARWPFEVIGKEGAPYVKVQCHGAETLFSPQQISAMVLTKMKQIAEMRFEDSNRILYLNYTGTVTPSTYVTHMPEVEEALARVNPSRLLLDWRGIEAWAPESESHAFYVRVRRRGDFGRVAIVGDAKWREEAGKVDEIMDCEVRFYEPNEEPEAWQWLKGD